jgi:hypothetical protein
MLVVLALVILVGGAAGLYVWGRMVTTRLTTEAAGARAAAAKSAVEETRAAERDARPAPREEAPPVGAAAGTGPAEEGRAVELARLIGRAVDAADTPQRKDEAKKLVEGAALELDSGRLHDGADALSTLQMAIGTGFKALGEPARAVVYLQAAATERKKSLGERDPATIRAQMELEDAKRAAAGHDGGR